MEIEDERRVVKLENSVREIEERLAEIHGELGSLSVEKSSIIKRVKQDSSSARKNAEDVRRLHADLNAKLSAVSDNLKSADGLVARLNSARKAVVKENRKEIGELAASVLGLNKRVAKLSAHFEDRIAAHQDPRMEPLYSEITSVRREMRKLSDEQNDALAKAEKSLKSVRKMVNDVPKPEKTDLSPLKRELSELKNSVSRLQESQKGFVDERKMRESLARLGGAIVTIENSFMKELRKVESEKAEPSFEVDRVDALEKRIEEIRARSNSVLRELYDKVENIAAPKAETPKAEAPKSDADLAALKTSLGVDMNNLKTVVAEVANKARLINDIALENQKLQSRLFLLEERLEEGKKVKSFETPV